MEVDEDPKTIESSEVLSFDGHTSEVNHFFQGLSFGAGAPKSFYELCLV